MHLYPATAEGRIETRMALNRHGFTVIEIIIVMLMLGVVAAITLPASFKSSPTLQVDRAARQMARDLDLVRMQAIASKRTVRVKFYGANDFYTAFMDITANRNGTITETSDEVRRSGIVARGALGGMPGAKLPKKVQFGCGNAGSGPLSYSCAGDPIFITDDRANFDTRGMLMPLGTTGVVYLVHEDDPEAVAAITLSGGGAFRYWRYRDGQWVH